MADEHDEQAAAPGTGTSPGWHPVPGDINAQAFWDGERWTRRRTWNGGMWVEVDVRRAGGAPGPVTGRATGPGPPSSGGPTLRGTGPRRRGITVVVVILVLAAAAAVVVVNTLKKSHSSTSGALAASSTTAATPGSAIPPAQTPAAALVAACQADAQAVVAAVTAYQARNGSAPTPASPWSAATYVADYGPLTAASGGRPYLPRAPATSQYVIEYDGAGHVWVAPPGAYEPSFNIGQSFAGNPDICLAAVR